MGCYREVRGEMKIGDTVEKEKDGTEKEKDGKEEKRTSGLT